MFMKYLKFIPRALIVLGILIGVFMVNPVCFAGGAVVLIPAEDNDRPEGSQIPKWRSEEIEKQVREYKEKMMEQYMEQQQEQLYQSETADEPNANNDNN